ncbi:MAG: hypothetical protein KGL39_19385 [Patescibacteria group bacterium]|nr:hypothetical protein [Patescibacteria group bacterium]
MTIIEAVLEGKKIRREAGKDIDLWIRRAAWRLPISFRWNSDTCEDFMFREEDLIAEDWEIFTAK